MRWLRAAVPAAVLAAWLVSAGAQQGAPPAETPPASPPPASTPPPRTPAPTAPAEEGQAAGAPSDEAAERVVIPTEELQPDAAVTFPVDI